jgi:hypothetical protein
MKKLFLISAVAIAGLNVSASASMEEEKAKSVEAKKQTEQPRRQRRGGHSKEAFMETYDSNNDGHVSTEEFYQKRDMGYDSRDIDGNGTVVSDEYVAEYENRLDKQLAEQRDRQLKQAYVRFDVLDGDKNDVMTREEFKAAGKRMFDRLDTNKDGVIDDKDSAERF